MPRPTRTACLALITAGCAAVAFAAVRAPKIAPPPDYTPDTEMMTKAGVPGMHHRFLNYFVGDWDVAVTMTHPGSPPMETQATASIAWDLDGRFLKESFEGEFMGQPFAGVSYIGYDNFKSRYVSIWMDSMSTGMTTSTGYQSLDGTELTFFGEMDEPALDLHDRTVKTITRAETQDRWTFEIHDLHIPDPNSKVMTMVYTRK